MRCRFHLCAVFVMNCKNLYVHILAVKRHNLDRITHAEFILLVDNQFSCRCHFFNCTKVDTVLHIGVTVVNLCLLVWFSIIKTSCKLTECACCDFLTVMFHLALIQFLRCIVIINCLPVCPGNNCYIQCCLHTSFYLERVDSCVNHIRDMLNHAEVLGIKDIRASVIFFHWKIFARSLLLHNRIFPTAWMRAGSLICISACKITAEQASSGIRYTHRSMHKCLDLHICRNMFPDRFDFL